MIGQTLGTYTIERELGRGGMGAVYTAVHSLLGRRAAVKVLLPELSKDQAIVQRFFNEARAATAIKHPSIVEIYDFGWAPDGSAFIVMELMEGESLATRLQRLGRLPVAQAVTIARQIANALGAAHKAGIVHRDLKPDNVFLVSDIEVATGERVKLLDFGIATLAAEGAASRTTTGAIMGTPVYMSPEQCEGARQVDHRTDLYALGCILFQMIAGRVPFESEGVGGLIGMHLYVAPPTLRSVVPDAPAEIEAVVARLLAKPPGERYQSAEELVAALGRAGTAPSFPPSMPHNAAIAPMAPSRSPPSTTLSAAASAGTVPRTESTSSKRGLWFALAGVGVVAAGVATVVAMAGGGGQAATSATTADATAIAVITDAGPDAGAVTIDAAPSTAGAVERLRTALETHRWDVAKRELDAIYDATTDGHPDRTAADELMAIGRPHIIAEARASIEAASKRSDCTGAKALADQAVDDWGDDALPLLKVAARCKSSRPKPPDPRPPDTGPPVPGPPDPRPPGDRLTKTEIMKVMSRARSSVMACGQRNGFTGTIRVRLEIATDGTVSSAAVEGGDSGPVDDCIARVVRPLRFPKAPAPTKITFPFDIRSGGPPPAERPEPMTGPVEEGYGER